VSGVIAANAFFDLGRFRRGREGAERKLHCYRWRRR
jgi:hypothetical protein